MNAEQQEFLRAYDEHRVREQIDFYAQRIDEYQRSASQISRLNMVLLGAAALCGAVGVVATGQNAWLGLVAAGLSAAAAALTAWGDIVGFSMNADLYRAALGGLRRLRPTRPDETATVPDDEVGRYVTDVENILLGEVRSWAETWTARVADDAESSGADDPDAPTGHG